MTIKRGWRNPPKEMPKKTKGKCRICHKEFQNLEAHYKAKHKGEKIPE